MKERERNQNTSTQAQQVHDGAEQQRLTSFRASGQDMLAQASMLIDEALSSDSQRLIESNKQTGGQ